MDSKKTLKIALLALCFVAVGAFVIGCKAKNDVKTPGDVHDHDAVKACCGSDPTKCCGAKAAKELESSVKACMPGCTKACCAGKTIKACAPGCTKPCCAKKLESGVKACCGSDPTKCCAAKALEDTVKEAEEAVKDVKIELK